MTVDPAAVLRAAADLAEKRARATGAIKGDNHTGRRWQPEWFVGPRVSLSDWVAEHIAAADPAFMLKRAQEWRDAADLHELYGPLSGTKWVSILINAITLPSALAYLRQDNGHA